MADFASQLGSDVLIRIKAVPGAARSQIAGVLGDRLKVRVAAPPEHGKANAAIIKLLANALGVSAGKIRIERGHTSQVKTVRLEQADVNDVLNALQPFID